MILTSLFIDHPTKICICYVVCFFLLTIFVCGMGFLEVDEVRPRDYQLWNSREQRDVDKLTLLDQYVNELEGTVSNSSSSTA